MFCVLFDSQGLHAVGSSSWVLTIHMNPIWRETLHTETHINSPCYLSISHLHDLGRLSSLTSIM